MATYYVKDDEPGGGDGSFTTPWNTQVSNVNTLGPDDTLRLMYGSGTLQESAEVLITTSGSGGAPITIVPHDPSNPPVVKGPSGAAVYTVEGDYITLDGLKINREQAHTQTVLVRSAAQSFRAVRCSVWNFAERAFRLNTAVNPVIENCDIWDGKVLGNDSIGVEMVGVTDGILRYSRIWNVAGDCFQVGSASTCSFQVLYNDLWTERPLGDDEYENAVDVKQGDSGTQSIVRGNRMWGFRYAGGSYPTGGPGWAMIFHQSADNVLVELNEVWDCACGIEVAAPNIVGQYNTFRDFVTDAGVWINSVFYVLSGNPTLQHNTVYNTPQDTYYIVAGQTPLLQNNAHHTTGTIVNNGSPTARNNGWYNSTQTISGAGDVTSDPQFVDPSGGDFHLQAGSPLIGAAYNGIDDIGRFQYEAQNPARLVVGARVPVGTRMVMG